MNWHGSRPSKVLLQMSGCMFEICCRRKKTKEEPSATAPPAGHTQQFIFFLSRVDASTLSIKAS